LKKFARRVGVTLGTLLLAAAALFYYLSGHVSVAADGNIIKNPGFEEADNGLPAAWKLEKKAADKGAVALVAGPVHAGHASLSLQPNALNSSDSLLDNPLGVGEGFPAGPFRGKRLYISAWMGATGGATAVVGLFGLTKAGGLISVELKQRSGIQNLAFHDDVLVLPDDRRIAYVIATCIAHGTSGAAYFDDVYVSTDVPPSFGAFPNEESKAAPPLSATIRVDAAKTLRIIPQGIYGHNLEWIWNGNGAWNPATNTLDPGVVALTRDLSPTLLRFPGGTFSDFYHWRDGVGPRGSRQPGSPTPGAGVQPNNFGTDEALAFADAVGSRLLITVNAGTGTAQEAADWVRYVNRDGRRRVDYWEIGNELYVNDGSPQSKVSTLSPDRYAAKVLEFADAMRRADPGIQIGAIGEENYSSQAPQSYPHWTEDLLRVAGGSIDFLAVHNGYAPALAMDKGWQLRTVYTAMLAAPVLVERNLTALAAKIDRFAPRSQRPIQIAVTEWGPYFQVTPDGRFVDHVKTLGSALYVAGMLKVLAESPRVELANAFKLVDPLFMGWIGKRGDEFVPTGPYFATQMFTRHFGTKLVACAVEGPLHDSPAVGWVDATPHVPDLDVVASVAEAEGKLYLLAINKNFDRAITSHISVEGFHPSAGTRWTLNGTALDANTGSQPFRAPGVKWAAQAVDSDGGRFDRGGPGELRISKEPMSHVGVAFNATFPAHSVVSLELDGQ
jgi:alpha-N-arabinofuranosidase